MTDQSPTVGRIVHYRLSDQDINDVFLMVGSRSDARADDVLPSVIIRTHEQGVVDLQVFLDAPGALYRTSVSHGDHQRQWSWPPRV